MGRLGFTESDFGRSGEVACVVYRHVHAPETRGLKNSFDNETRVSGVFSTIHL